MNYNNNRILHYIIVFTMIGGFYIHNIFEKPVLTDFRQLVYMIQKLLAIRLHLSCIKNRAD